MNGTSPVTNDDLDEALRLALDPINQRLSTLFTAFPDGVENHRIYHQSKIDAARAEKEFWDTAKKAVITQGVNGVFNLVKIILILAAFGLISKFAFPDALASLAKSFLVK